MSKFKQYLDNDDMVCMLEMVWFFNEYNEDSVNEAIVKDILGKFKTLLSKFGLKGHSSGKGLIQVLTTATKNVTTLLYYAFYVSQGNEEYKDKIKELVKKVKREDVMDVLFKLDALTLHAITGPIHIIDAITGWHIGPDSKSNAMNVDDRAKKVITHMKALIDNTIGDTKKKMERFLKQLKNNFKYSSQISSNVLG